MNIEDARGSFDFSVPDPEVFEAHTEPARSISSSSTCTGSATASSD